MPYSIKMDSGKHCVVKKADGKKMGCHDSHDKAVKQMQALHANEAMASMLWVDPFNYTEGQPFRVFPIGSFKRGERTIELTAERLKQIAANYNKGHPRWKIPIYPGHPTDANTDPAKIGNATKLEFREGDGLYAYPEYTEDGKKNVADGAYQYVSPGIIWSGYTDENGNEISDVLDHVALTNRPFFGSRTAIFSSDEGIMKSTDTMAQIREAVKDALTDLFADKKKKPLDTPDTKSEETEEEDEDESMMKDMKGKQAMSDPIPTETFDAKAKVDELAAQLKVQADTFAAQLAAEKTRADEFAAKLQAEQTKRRKSELKQVAESFTALPVKPDEYAENFYALEQANPNLAKWFADQFAQFETVAATGGLFSQFSRENAQHTETVTLEKLSAKIKAEEFKADGKSRYTNTEAMIEAGKRRPDLVERYIPR